MTQGVVYFRYENKDALALAVTERFYLRICEIADFAEQLGLHPSAPSPNSCSGWPRRSGTRPVIQAGARLQLERQPIGVRLPLPYEGDTRLITSWLAGEREAGARDDLPPPGTLAAVLVSAFFGAQHISWVLDDRADLVERTTDLVRTIIPSAQGGIESCPSAPQRCRG
ncbi:TetR/AcrR family transcriptional regulator [Streptomyces sp. NPDC049627]|uniref:TetR/AcrR family transcriptional regulator n=1 Tax=Streptomyces sp. NPDC049627 TaxID=3365595 RepID=UPI003791A4F2